MKKLFIRELSPKSRRSDMDNVWVDYVDGGAFTLIERRRAHQIVRAVNSHDHLVEALEIALKLISVERGWGTWPRMEDSAIYREADLLRGKATAALKSAKGEA